MDEIIVKAIEKVQSGWTQGTYEHNGRYCGIGAIASVVAKENNVSLGTVLHGVRDFWDEVTARSKVMAEVAAEQYGERMTGSMTQDGSPHFPEFNDHEDTNKDDVIAIMEKAAVRYAEKI
jgi:hypothetical protein